MVSQARRISGHLQLHVNAQAERGCDVDQGVEREPRDAATQQIIDTWLSEVAARGGFLLRPPLGGDEIGEAAHQIRSGA